MSNAIATIAAVVIDNGPRPLKKIESWKDAWRIKN